jgi:hypothetical protein
MTRHDRLLATVGAVLGLLVAAPTVAAHGGEAHAAGIHFGEIAAAAGVIIVLGAAGTLIGRLWPAASAPVDRGQVVADDGEELPHPGHALQRMPASALEPDAGADHEVLDDA